MARSNQSRLHAPQRVMAPEKCRNRRHDGGLLGGDQAAKQPPPSSADVHGVDIRFTNAHERICVARVAPFRRGRFATCSRRNSATSARGASCRRSELAARQVVARLDTGPRRGRSNLRRRRFAVRTARLDDPHPQDYGRDTFDLGAPRGVKREGGANPPRSRHCDGRAAIPRCHWPRGREGGTGAEPSVRIPARSRSRDSSRERGWAVRAFPVSPGGAFSLPPPPTAVPPFRLPAQTSH